MCSPAHEVLNVCPNKRTHRTEGACMDTCSKERAMHASFRLSARSVAASAARRGRAPMSLRSDYCWTTMRPAAADFVSAFPGAMLSKSFCPPDKQKIGRV